MIKKNTHNLVKKSQFFSTKKTIKKWLDKNYINHYTINDDLSVDVNGDVYLSGKNLKAIPVKFGNVTGGFLCNSNNLTNLFGSPETVGGYFDCSHNQLITLVGSPKSVGGSFACEYNNLTNLIGFAFPSVRSPKSIAFNFYCNGNPLISLVEMIGCNFGHMFCFNVDKDNFKPKELVKLLEKYYNKNNKTYQLTMNDFHATIKPQIEKEILQQKINKSKAKIQIKASFL